MYFVPEMHGGNHYGAKVDVDDVKFCKDMYAVPKEICSREFKELASLLKPDTAVSRNAEEAFNLCCV